jgi:sarcosine oxidase delta subunit
MSPRIAGLRVQRKAKNQLLISVPLPTSADGTVGRKCPDCRRFFKVGREGLDRPHLHCPYCGSSHRSASFLTLDQRRRLRSAAQRIGLAEAHRMLGEAFSGFSSTSGLLQIRLERGELEIPPMLTYVERETIRTRPCAACTNQSSVYGIALFCPICGKRDSLASFEESIQAARSTVATLSALPAATRSGLEARGGMDRTIEHLLADAVTGFEVYCRSRFEELQGSTALTALLAHEGRNVFQRLDDAIAIMESALSRTITGTLDAAELAELRLAFAARHVLTHNFGIADAKYVASGGPTPEGQRIQVTQTMALRSLALMEKLVRAMA